MKYVTNSLAKFINKALKLLKLKIQTLNYILRSKSIRSIYYPCNTRRKIVLKNIKNICYPCITRGGIVFKSIRNIHYPCITRIRPTIKYKKNLINNWLNTDNGSTLNLSSLTSSAERQYTEMLTLERKVSHVKQLVKQIDPDLEYQEIELKNFSYRTSSKRSVKELLLSGNFFIKLFAEKIENNWQEQIEEQKLKQFKELLLEANEAIEELKYCTHWKINRKGFGKPDAYLNVKKELRIINKSLMYLSQVLSDTIEFVNIASEITELRSKPVAESESDKIQQILAKSEEIARQKKELPTEGIKKGMEDILEAMKKT